MVVKQKLQSKSKDVRNIIEKGGGSKSENRKDESVTFTFKLSAEIADLIEQDINEQKVKPSRNRWILEAIIKRLEEKNKM